MLHISTFLSEETSVGARSMLIRVGQNIQKNSNRNGDLYAPSSPNYLLFFSSSSGGVIFLLDDDLYDSP